MITGLDPQNAMFVDNVDRIESTIAKASNQVSSGLSITQPSDAPDEIGALLQLRANELHNSQIQANLTLAQNDAQAADNALSSSIQLMDSATTLATQGATATADAETRASLAQQVGSILQQMVANSQTNVQGRYIFSGDQDSAPQYTWDSTQVNPVVAAPNPAASTRQIESPASGTFSASLTAQQIFDDQDATTNRPAADNVFQALTTLQTALTNNDTAGITNSITLLNAASTHLNSMQSFYGNVEDEVQNASTYASQYDVQLKTQISNIQDADITAAATELTLGNTQLQAAMEMKGQLPHSSLFNYLG